MASEKSVVHSGHRARMRSRFFETGLDGFQPHEILEMLLFCVIPKRDVNPIAHALLDEFGSVDAVLSASPEELARVPGVGAQAGEFFQALDALSIAYRSGSRDAPQNLATLAAALRYVPASARSSSKYSVTVIFADRFNRPLSVCSFPGRPDDPLIIRAIMSKTLSLHAHSAVVFCCGYRRTPLVGKHELDALQSLVGALAGVDCYTTDCVLLSRDHLLSLRRENLLSGHATELQGELSRWEYWLGPIAAESENRWRPVSLLESIDHS